MKLARLLFASLLVLTTCTPGPATRPVGRAAPSRAPTVSSVATASASPAPQPARQNPFFRPSPLACQYPPFDQIRNDDYMPAFEAGMAEQRKEVDAIAHDAAAPTFQSTVVALEKTGRLLGRVQKAFTNLNASSTNDVMQKIELDMAPRLAAHQDAILLDPLLFGRVDAVYQQRDKLGLDPESAQLLNRYAKLFERAGAHLSDPDKATLKKINQELSSLTTQFRQAVLKATKDGGVVVDDVKQLEGLSPVEIGAAAEAAKVRGLAGKWLIALQNTTIQPALEHMSDRALRERLYRASVARCNGGVDDTTGLVTKILTLRARKAALLGYPSYAAWSLAEETAETPAAVNEILGELAPAALAKGKEEARAIQARIDADARAAHQKPFALEPWDWAYYALEVRKDRFEFDDAEVRPYFELSRVLQDGAFYAAHELYGISFQERHDLPVYNPDVRVLEVRDTDGSTIGLLLLDFYQRDDKQGGGWMDTFVDESKLLALKPVVTINMNLPRPAPGEPALLTFDDVTTLFHELGHGLHGLLTVATYPLLSGTNVPADFVEFPSQLNEMWMRERSVLAHFAKHYKTGAPMPAALLDKVLKAQKYGVGYSMTEYLEAAIIDQAWHQIPLSKVPAASQVMAFEQQALVDHHVAYAPVPPRYHTAYFGHVFEGGYEAAYYAYIWSEVLARDAGAWFDAHGGLTRANGDVFRAKVLSQGRMKEPRVQFESFYGGPPDIKPLLEYEDLKLPTTASKRTGHR
jgi:peptidyl-dipeptidase Dcp